MCRGYMKRLRRHQSMVTLGLGAGAVSLGSHTDTVRRDAPTCLAMQGPGDQVVLALGHTVPGTDQHFALLTYTTKRKRKNAKMLKWSVARHAHPDPTR